ncbi:sulfatase [Cognatishimia activa]|uniref:Arylsulfatase n=1 Tax=Cognatishimia activa TaxID=1715691 RepID=A0A0P1J776_9RHOB|nr:sulfatase [Cognatishimia activa]CUI97400.1 Arylsulfatase [Cognatishimia activa]CUK25943.1 Arylsulfatase [Cognatishimia activa]
MKTVFLLFDSLIRDQLPGYGGCAERLPNFARLDARSTRFDNHWVGSLPCMPARRDMHNGRLNFFHRSWGPLEPFDDSFVTELRNSGIYTHLITDHYHYFEEGGCNFHTKFNSWELFRGQETDAWRGAPPPNTDDILDDFDPTIYDLSVHKHWRHAVNRAYMRKTEDFPIDKSFSSALRFLDENQLKDNWFLKLEVFDPHEPFHAPEEFLKAEGVDLNAPIADWPAYGEPEYSKETSENLQRTYRALLRFCDYQLGRLLDAFDEHDLWQDTALIVTTDHGFMLSEHNTWGKSVMPLYHQVSRIPLFMHLPGSTPVQCTTGLSQTTDLAPTVLDVAGVPCPPDMTGSSLQALSHGGVTERKFAIFGIWGGPINCTDGRYVMFLQPKEPSSQDDLYLYSMMPVDFKTPLKLADLQLATQCAPFEFTKGMPVWKIPATGIVERGAASFLPAKTTLFDLELDPNQNEPVTGELEIEAKLKNAMLDELKAHDAPTELISRFEFKNKELTAAI